MINVNPYILPNPFTVFFPFPIPCSFADCLFLLLCHPQLMSRTTLIAFGLYKTSVRFRLFPFLSVFSLSQAQNYAYKHISSFLRKYNEMRERPFYTEDS